MSTNVKDVPVGKDLSAGAESKSGAKGNATQQSVPGQSSARSQGNATQQSGSGQSSARSQGNATQQGGSGRSSARAQGKSGVKVSAKAKSAAAVVVDPAKMWLYKPAIDLLIGCAGWTAPLLLVLYFWSGASAAVGVTFYALALFFNYPHYTATIYRAYRTREDFSRYRLFTIHLTLLIIAGGAIAHWAGWLIPWLFTIYITWSPWHYSGQNFGLAMMFARRAGLKPSKAERNALYISFLASYGIVFLTMHSGVSLDPYVKSLDLPVGLGAYGRVVLGVVFALTGPWALYRLGRRGGWRLIAAPLTLFATQFLWFVLPFILQIAYNVEVPQTRYSTGVLAVMHSAQYLWVTSYYARREALASGAEGWRPRSYFASLIIGGIALFLPGPWLISYAFHYNFTSSVLVFTAIVNIHHFMLDGAIWKLRDNRIAALLISSPAKVSSSLWGVAGWVAGKSPSARAFRITAAALLVLLAVLDQTRFFFAVDASDVSSLERAVRLNPYDAGVHASLGRAREDSNDVDRAISEFEQSVRLNPYNPEVRGTFFKLLLEQGRYEQAYSEYKSLAAYTKDDPDALVNFGILADKLGHRDEAIQSWKGAVSLTPDNKSAQLYLADALYATGKQKEAIPHYERYLALLPSDPEAVMDPSDVVGVTVRIGDAYSGIKSYERAMKLYERASAIAEKTGDKSLESLVVEHKGNLLAEAGRPAQAGDFYQQALRLDEGSKDQRAAGLDWFSFAQFLNDQGKPKNLVLACLLKAEDLLAASPGPELNLVKHYQENTESSLASEGGDSVAKVKSDREALLKQALTVRF